MERLRVMTGAGEQSAKGQGGDFFIVWHSIFLRVFIETCFNKVSKKFQNTLDIHDDPDYIFPKSGKSPVNTDEAPDLISSIPQLIFN